MKYLCDKELNDINGGGITIATAIGISAVVVFAIGVIDGFVNPEKCK